MWHVIRKCFTTLPKWKECCWQKSLHSGGWLNVVVLLLWWLVKQIVLLLRPKGAITEKIVIKKQKNILYKIFLTVSSYDKNGLSETFILLMWLYYGLVMYGKHYYIICINKK